MDFAIYQKLIEQNAHTVSDGVMARFYDRAIKTSAVDDNGMPVFKTVCYCEIRLKDNTTEVFDQPATDEKIERFPVEYARYQLSKKQVSDGTPLEQFAFLTVSEVEACKYRGIFTVEALAALSDEHAHDLSLVRERELAQKFMALGKTMKQAVDWEAERTRYRHKIGELEAEVGRLKRIVNGRIKR